jgi:hypothetical protein
VRRAVIRAQRRRTRVVSVTVVRRSAYPVYNGGRGICAPLGPRGGGKAARRARAYRIRQRKQALHHLNLHC